MSKLNIIINATTVVSCDRFRNHKTYNKTANTFCNKVRNNYVLATMYFNSHRSYASDCDNRHSSNQWAEPQHQVHNTFNYTTVSECHKKQQTTVTTSKSAKHCHKHDRYCLLCCIRCKAITDNNIKPITQSAKT